MTLTKTEEEVADYLEYWEEIKVFRPSYPDFIVYNPKTDAFCFVEVKSRYDTTSYRQSQTFKLMRELGLPVIVVKPKEEERLGFYRRIRDAMVEIELYVKRKRA